MKLIAGVAADHISLNVSSIVATLEPVWTMRPRVYCPANDSTLISSVNLLITFKNQTKFYFFRKVFLNTARIAFAQKRRRCRKCVAICTASEIVTLGHHILRWREQSAVRKWYDWHEVVLVFYTLHSNLTIKTICCFKYLLCKLYEYTPFLITSGVVPEVALWRMNPDRPTPCQLSSLSPVQVQSYPQWNWKTTCM